MVVPGIMCDFEFLQLQIKNAIISGTTLVLRFVHGPMFDAFSELQKKLGDILGEDFHPQQNLHATIGSGALDAKSEREYNRYNSDTDLVKDLKANLVNLAKEIVSGNIDLPEKWERLFLAVITDSPGQTRTTLGEFLGNDDRPRKVLADRLPRSQAEALQRLVRFIPDTVGTIWVTGDRGRALAVFPYKSNGDWVQRIFMNLLF